MLSSYCEKASVMNRSTVPSPRPLRIPLRLHQPATRRRKAGSLARQLTSHAAQVRESERKRIARDLHDDLGYRLMATILELDRMTCRYQETARLADDLARLRSYLVQTADAMHDIAVDLSSRTIADLGLSTALANLARRSETASGARIEIATSGELDSLSPAVALVAYRIAQEALTNALRHAEASTITISATVDHGRLILAVADDGVGCGATDPATTGRPALGIRGMRERAAAFDGRLELISRPGQGTTVRASLPVKE